MEIIGNANISLLSKLKDFKKEIQEWNTKINGRFEVNISKLEHQLQLCDQGKAPDGRSGIEKQLKKEYQARESILKQKSREKWIAEGDMNTKFFHAQVRRKTYKNKITGTWNNGEWVTEPLLVKELFAAHFEKRFKATHNERCFGLGTLNLPGISCMEANQMEDKFNKHEILYALDQMEPSKAPGQMDSTQNT